MQKNKILFLINKLGTGGAENVFLKDANHLTNLGYDVYFSLVFGDPEEQPLLSKLNVPKEKILFCEAKNLFDLKALYRLVQFIKKNNINVLYSTLNEANIFSRLSAFWRHGARVIIREANVADPKPLKFKFLDLVLNIFVKKIVCVSEEVKDSLLKYLWLYRRKMVVLPNGVDIPVKQKDYSYMNMAKEIKEPVRFLNVGSLTIKKGHKILIEACALVQKEAPDCFSLDIIGDGVERENLEKLIKDINLEDKVKLLGKQDKEKVGEHYLNSDVFLLSSLWEGSPNVLLEAMSYGLVCISTRVSGALDMIEDGVSGHLVPKGDSKALVEKMLEVIKDQENFQTIGNNARKKMIEEYAFPIYIKRLENVLSL